MRRLWYLLALYALVVIYTQTFFVRGMRPPLWITPLATLIGFVLVLLHAMQRLGRSAALLLLGSTAVVSFIFEAVGVATGLVYGPYHYTDRLGPRLLDVPFLIPLAWFLMAYPSYLFAQTLAPRTSSFRRALWVAALSGLIMTSWDLVMDPQMVKGDHWVWEVEGPYFGIPLRNFWGWWLTIFVAILLFYLLNRPANRWEPRQEDAIPWLVYFLTGGASTFASFFIGLEGTGVVGIFVLLPWLVLTFPYFFPRLFQDAG
uniref:Hypothetical conserved protein n=1 Tax=uncultured Chloroflexota bacterium TaxID=166587 RepID=H5SMW6_9CHLR|nr:hypothetical conserved protein [uncultured Chloroflexota bacterium]